MTGLSGANHQVPATRRTAVLVDFGGVLTSSVLDAIGDFGQEVCGDRALPLRLLTSDIESKRLLVDREEGRISARTFETAFAGRLRAHGAESGDGGLLHAVQSRIRHDSCMIELIGLLRAAGIPVGLISNSLGVDDYAGLDLGTMFDAVAISGREGVRKPSRRLYEIACERLGVPPHKIVMVDDLQQNIDAAERLGMAGIVHREAGATTTRLGHLLGMDITASGGGSRST
ncbi:HAD-IA family hydrolase [Amycolatopsis sp. ATCC 39116]|uniref:HAD-IA family hydrolase n=1 Tax=Amycolatopsis sp. (strain ATCC 39116 / 75iv2) TaxID=385957 RepID=UPI000262557E|nr:HAD-IA family hydrolase [Amycolatopsis sp. ATCC 39116]